MSRYILPFFIVMLAGAMYLFVIDGTYKNIVAGQAKQVELTDYLTQAKDAAQKLDTIANQYKSFPENADQRLSTILPDSVDSVKLIVDINNIAKVHGLEVLSPKVSPEAIDKTKPKKFLTHTISFQTFATYGIFHEFIRDLEKSMVLHDFNKISFTANVADDSKSANQPEFAVFNYQVELTSYALH